MNLNKSLKMLKMGLRKNSPTILVSFGVSGTVLTAYLTGKASFKAANELRDKELEIKDAIKEVFPLYIPAVISGIATIGFIVGANRISSKRAAAAYSVMTISERMFEEYKEKVIEKIGERKEQEIRDEIAQDRVEANKPNTILVGSGEVICCELGTGRYFKSDMETLRKAQNDINAKLVRELYVPLSEFYYIIGLSPTSYSWDVGWVSEKHMALEFSTVLTDDNKPCLAFEYNYIKPL